MRNTYSPFASVLLAALVGGCGSGQTRAAAPGDGAGASPASSFDDMSSRERMDLMKKVVVPTMKPIFQGFDAEQFAEFTCATCHGSGAEQGEFKMPNPELPKLPANGAFDDLLKEKPEIMDVMQHQVVPEMAQALGMQPFDPATGVGFGCYDCHTSK